MSAAVETPAALVLRALHEVVGSEHGHRVLAFGTGPDVAHSVAFTSSNGEMVSLDDVSAALFHLGCQLVAARAALAAIADLETEEPRAIAYNDNALFFLASGRFKAAEMARKGLVQP